MLVSVTVSVLVILSEVASLYVGFRIHGNYGNVFPYLYDDIHNKIIFTELALGPLRFSSCDVPS